MNEKDILARLEALEARVAKLEGIPAGGSKFTDDNEVITHYKSTSNSYYVKTSKDRVLELSNRVYNNTYGISNDYIHHLNTVLSFLKEPTISESASANECKMVGGAHQYIIADGTPSNKSLKF